MLSEQAPLLRLLGIAKSFADLQVLVDVNVDFHAGEIHTLLGENGAGKSTLMNILTGLYRADAGSIELAGDIVHSGSPADSLDQGIGMVHQHFMLIRSHTVLENLLLSVPESGWGLGRVRWQRRARDLIAQLELDIELDDPVWKLSIGQQQWVEILKLLLRDCRVLILDEPTAVLTPQEARKLFGFLDDQRSLGKAIVFISHKMHEIMEISDRVSVLRSGELVACVPRDKCSPEYLARLMIGDQEIPSWHKPPISPEAPLVLQMQDLWARNDFGLSDLQGVDLQLRRGEILGIAGIAGNGQKALAEVLTGLREPHRGEFELVVPDDLSSDAVPVASIGHVPEDRKAVGIAPDMDIAQNLILRSYRHADFRRGWFLDFTRIALHARDCVQRFSIRTGNMQQPVRLMSGGNIQKVILARELSLRPLILVALYPTRGLDLGSAEYVHKTLAEAQERGMSTILISEDLDELLALSDRLAVIFQGRIQGVVDPSTTSREQIGLLMSGREHDNAAG